MEFLEITRTSGRRGAPTLPRRDWANDYRLTPASLAISLLETTRTTSLASRRKC